MREDVEEEMKEKTGSETGSFNNMTLSHRSQLHRSLMLLFLQFLEKILQELLWCKGNILFRSEMRFFASTPTPCSAPPAFAPCAAPTPLTCLLPLPLSTLTPNHRLHSVDALALAPAWHPLSQASVAVATAAPHPSSGSTTGARAAAVATTAAWLGGAWSRAGTGAVFEGKWCQRGQVVVGGSKGIGQRAGPGCLTLPPHAHFHCLPPCCCVPQLNDGVGTNLR